MIGLKWTVLVISHRVLDADRDTYTRCQAQATNIQEELHLKMFHTIWWNMDWDIKCQRRISNQSNHNKCNILTCILKCGLRLGQYFGIHHYASGTVSDITGDKLNVQQMYLTYGLEVSCSVSDVFRKFCIWNVVFLLRTNLFTTHHHLLTFNHCIIQKTISLC